MLSWQGEGDRPKDDLLNRSHLMKKKCDPFHFSRSQDGKISRLEISRDIPDPTSIVPITNQRQPRDYFKCLTFYHFVIELRGQIRTFLKHNQQNNLGISEKILSGTISQKLYLLNLANKIEFLRLFTNKVSIQVKLSRAKKVYSMIQNKHNLRNKHIQQNFSSKYFFCIFLAKCY